MTNRPACSLPLPGPTNPVEQLLLIALRRMGTHGLRDAGAAMLVIERFGLGFQRPLVLMRAYVMELARASRRKIMLAPCCARRMTIDEGRMLAVLALIQTTPAGARHHLRQLCDGGDVDAAFSVGVMLADTLAGMGQPIAR